MILHKLSLGLLEDSPAISSDGLGRFIAGTSLGRTWILCRDPGGEVAHAQPLSFQTPKRPESCIWFCDKFVLFYTSSEVIVARFKGIHDNYYG